MSVLAWTGLAVAGGAGSVARVRLDRWVQRRVNGGFPAGTLVVNVLGSFILGLLTGLGLDGGALLVAGTGLLGSFTTFSTWMFETERLAEESQGRAALLNVAVSLTAGSGAAVVGWALGALA